MFGVDGIVDVEMAIDFILENLCEHFHREVDGILFRITENVCLLNINYTIQFLF